MLVHEASLQQGGAPLDEQLAQCPPRLREHIFGGDAAEAECVGGVTPPRPIVLWERVPAFQLISLKKIVAAVLTECPATDPADPDDVHAHGR